MMDYQKQEQLKRELHMAHINQIMQSILLLHFLSSTSMALTTLQAFINCFTNQTQSPGLISLPNTPSYSSVLLSSVQNQRFIYSPSSSKPSIIISAASEQHVQSTVLCAGFAGLPLRVRSGGHDYEGMSYAASSSSPFATLDISALRSVSVNHKSHTAWVQAGATLGELYYAVSKNLSTYAFPAGICPTIGIGGHFAGGGIGLLTRRFGASIDNVVDALLVDAYGRVLDRNSMGEELFWALRGAGSAGFGVILAYKVKLVDIPPVVAVFSVGRTLKQNATVLISRWQEVAPKLDPNLVIRAVAQASTDEDGRKTILVNFISSYLGSKKELSKLVQSNFPELGVQAADCIEMTYLESIMFFYGVKGKPVELLLDRKPQFNSFFKAKSDFVHIPIPESGLEEIWKFLMEGFGENSVALILEPWGGIMDEIEEDTVAFPHRKGNIYNVQYFMRWSEGEESLTQRHLEWMKKLYAFMEGYVSSKPRAAYYNYKDIDLGWNEEGRETDYSTALDWGEKYFKGNFRRLAKVKAAVDPENFFWNEQSVPALKTR